MKSGFSLLELVITISIACILMIFIVPGFRQLMMSSKSDVSSKQLMRTLEFSRNLAMNSGQKITICPCNNQMSCSGEWCDGYIVLQNQKIIFTHQNNNKNEKIHWRAFPFYLKNIEYLPTGLSNFENGTFWYCDGNSKYPLWAIMLSKSGRMRLVMPDKSGEIRDNQGNLFVCE